jgi:hypothetical protein
MRCYFHLVNGDHVIRDEDGMEVPDLGAARRGALTAISDTLAGDPRLAHNRAGWTLRVTDASGDVLFTLPVENGLGN